MTHLHRCGGCGKEWLDSNPRCRDLPTQRCCGASAPPALLRVLGLEAAGHAIHEAEFYYRRLREVEIADALVDVRELMLSRAAALSAEAGFPLELPA